MAKVISPQNLTDDEARRFAKSQGYQTIVAISHSAHGTEILAF